MHSDLAKELDMAAFSSYLEYFFSRKLLQLHCLAANLSYILRCCNKLGAIFNCFSKMLQKFCFHFQVLQQTISPNLFKLQQFH